MPAGCKKVRRSRSRWPARRWLLGWVRGSRVRRSLGQLAKMTVMILSDVDGRSETMSKKHAQIAADIGCVCVQTAITVAKSAVGRLSWAAAHHFVTDALQRA